MKQETRKFKNALIEATEQIRPKRFVMGDIHGGYRAIGQVMERAGFDNENDELIALGDVCDGWSETHLAIDKLMSVKNLTYILGNHDQWFLQFVEAKMAGKDMHMGELRTWMANGGFATMNSYKNFDDQGATYNKEMLIKHYDFLKAKHKMYHVTDDNILFVHAGFNNDVPIEKNSPHDLCWDRWFWREVYGGNTEISKMYKKVFIGHTPTLNWDTDQPIGVFNVWNVDTGAAYDGKLTIMEVDTGKYWQSDRVWDLYPGENGRNRAR